MAVKTKIPIIVGLLLGTILVLNILSVRYQSITYDEPFHYKYGSNILSRNSNKTDQYDDSKMPFSAFNALPKRVGDKLWPVIKSEKLYSFLSSTEITARCVTILFSMLLAFYVFRWSTELYGRNAGILSLLLYSFSPNIIAHSHLVTTDLYAACMITIATYYFWKFINVPDWKNAMLSATTLGLSQLAKYTCAYLYPIFLLIAFYFYYVDLVNLLKIRNWKETRMSCMRFLKYIGFFIFVSLMIINIGFLFNRPFTPLGNYEFKSKSFKSIQQAGASSFPVPVPYPYLQGMDWVKESEETGSGFGPNVYLLGRLHVPENNEINGFYGYYFIAFLFKEPIGAQLIIILSALFFIFKRKRFNFRKNEIFLIWPVLFFTIYFNFFYRAQTGIRHFLVVLPFLYIFCGNFFKYLEKSSLNLKALVTVLFVYIVMSVLSYYPTYIPYFNELVWDRKQAYRILADSNIDFNQGKKYLARYKMQNPDVGVNPEAIEGIGRIVVSVNELVGVGCTDAEKYKCLRENVEPIDHVAYSYLVYNITAESLEKIRECSDKGKGNFRRGL